MAWPLKVRSSCRRTSAAGGDADLLAHQIDAEDRLGHRVLDLQAGVHLDEVELAVLVEELDRARAFDSPDRRWPWRRSRRSARGALGVDGGAGGLLQHLLVAALQRTVALAQMHRAALAVAEDLHLDMARAAEVFLDIDLVIAEGGLGLGARGAEGVFELGLAVRATFMPRPPPPAVALMMTG
jgi:hypothetical protein